MNISIHQPDYIPYLGLFYKLFQSKAFIFLNDAQFSNDNNHHWNRIKTPQGELKIKIPVDYKFGDSIDQVRTKDELGWKEKHLKSIHCNYARAKHFDEIFSWLSNLLLQDYPSLSAQNIAITKSIINGFGFKLDYYLSSDFSFASRKEERVIDLCCKMHEIYNKPITYISGNGARAYEVEDHFAERKIKLVYSDYAGSKYKQLWKNFVPNMSIIDFLFNYGFDKDAFDNSIVHTKDE